MLNFLLAAMLFSQMSSVKNGLGKKKNIFFFYDLSVHIGLFMDEEFCSF